MKQKFFRSINYLLLAIFCIGITSCNSDDDTQDIVFDFMPVIVGFDIVGTDGKTLIEKNGPLYGKDFYVQYDGKDFDAVWDTEMPTRAIMTHIYGLYYSDKFSKDNPRLVFGELNGDLGEATLSLFMPNGMKHRIDISRHIYVNGTDAYAKQQVRLDGKVIDSLTDGGPNISITIVYDTEKVEIKPAE